MLFNFPSTSDSILRSSHNIRILRKLNMYKTDECATADTNEQRRFSQNEL